MLAILSTPYTVVWVYGWGNLKVTYGSETHYSFFIYFRKNQHDTLLFSVMHKWDEMQSHLRQSAACG